VRGIGCRRAAVATVLLLALSGCTPGAGEQSRFEDDAQHLAAPSGLQVKDPPTLLCPTFSGDCTDPTVVATWMPVDLSPDAGDLCTTYLAWASALGVDRIFVSTELDWPGWYDKQAHALVITGAVETVAIEDAAATCATAVQHTLDLPEGAGQHDRTEVIGITGVDGVAGGLLVTRLMPPRSVPDAAPLDNGVPFMVAAAYVLV